ncbi:NADP-specific glutamate dehydrogenase [Fodinibius salsisoli]|uniref:Glutamate dehydrogenase n=1 Tax=Fodinibius salsisoli TaxID=2820877 RepID=A0ABT3PIC3_9BACT|nr:NADP-specific glutamate dehydrogenase [Fodinibius salsisoli]MCW9705503.1 NADP-specific glutamate dehydrogenase [Fodinibius salsisoli]
MDTDNIVAGIKKRNPHQPTFYQAVAEVLDSIKPVLDKDGQYKEHKIIERLVEPDRIISFKVTWQDDDGEIHVNRGYRVQMNSALGPYKGGLRYDPSVNQDILKFLAFEQTFKNALTGIPLGSGKGGSDFNPKGKSDDEIMRFCQSFMSELYRYIGPDVDVPAGDIGVGSREIGYLFGAYKKLKNEFSGVLTGKGVNWGGSLIRTEATGYGLIFFALNMLAEQNESLKGKKCLVSGAGNVAQYAIEKIIQEGSMPVTVSDSDGFIYDDESINEEKLEFIKRLKNEQRGRIKEYADEFSSGEYTEVDGNSDSNPLWDIEADCAFPCATQNEVQEKDARHLVDHGIQLIAEGANMPLTPEALEVIRNADVLYAPGKATNAGGVAISGLEMTQNKMGVYWSRDRVSSELQEIMREIHEKCIEAASEYDLGTDYLAGANIAGFKKVAQSMIAQGVV